MNILFLYYPVTVQFTYLYMESNPWYCSRILKIKGGLSWIFLFMSVIFHCAGGCWDPTQDCSVVSEKIWMKQKEWSLLSRIFFTVCIPYPIFGWYSVWNIFFDKQCHVKKTYIICNHLLTKFFFVFCREMENKKQPFFLFK